MSSDADEAQKRCVKCRKSGPNESARGPSTGGRRKSGLWVRGRGRGPGRRGHGWGAHRGVQVSKCSHANTYGVCTGRPVSVILTTHTSPFKTNSQGISECSLHLWESHAVCGTGRGPGHERRALCKRCRRVWFPLLNSAIASE